MSEYESGADQYSVNAQQTRVSNNNCQTPKVTLHFIQKKCGHVDSPECLTEVGHTGKQLLVHQVH